MQCLELVQLWDGCSQQKQHANTHVHVCHAYSSITLAAVLRVKDALELLVYDQ